MAARWDEVQSDNSTMRCYVTTPATTPAPVVVVIQHAGGVDQFVQTMTDRIAEAGFVGISPDLYHREEPGTGDDPMTRMGRLRDRNIVADVNLDMFLPLYPLKVIEVQGLTESTLGDSVRAAAAELGVDVQTDREPEQNRFIRSDQYSFIRRGVPSLAFKFGYESGSAEEKIRRDWVRDVYHKPNDDVKQPVDIEAAARFNRVILGLLERVANDGARPKWHDTSFFKRFSIDASR